MRDGGLHRFWMRVRSSEVCTKTSRARNWQLTETELSNEGVRNGRKTAVLVFAARWTAYGSHLPILRTRLLETVVHFALILECGWLNDGAAMTILRPMKMPNDPAAPCPCPSGLPYGECHKPIIEAGDSELLAVSHREYARRWEGNASAYEAQGLYGCLTAHLLKFGPVRRVIDVGCGRGQGLAELRKLTGANGLLVGIDENPDCLAAAAERLSIALPATRLVRVSGPGRNYDVQPVAGWVPPVASVVLIQADMLRPDVEFEDWILALAPVDVVTMWFSGVHPARQHDKIVQKLDIGSDRKHRMANDLAAMDLARAVLPAGGLLQIVGRGTTNDQPWLIGETADTMRALAQHGPFEVVDVELHRYEEPTDGPRIAVGAAGIPGHTLYATSTILRRRP